MRPDSWLVSSLRRSRAPSEAAGIGGVNKEKTGSDQESERLPVAFGAVRLTTPASAKYVGWCGLPTDEGKGATAMPRD